MHKFSKTIFLFPKKVVTFWKQTARSSRIAFTLTLTAIVILAILGRIWMLSEHQNDKAIQKSHIQPVIFVPGSSATIQRFNSLFTTLNAETKKGAAHSILKVQVNNDGTLSYSGHLSTANRQPFIVVGFERNQDNYPTVQADAQSLGTVMADLQAKYHFRNFSAVGHSNGGLIWTDYLENYYSSNSFHIKTLMTLGTPFNFSETSTTKKTTMLSDFIANSSAIPTDLSVYSIAGSDDYTDDGLVNVQSVLTGKYIFQKQVAKYTQTTVSGENAQHSKLPENPEVINLIRELILDNKANEPNSSANKLKKESADDKR
ncbi:alpha/beta hydrolase [Fructobacillus sp. CRL 2054]|uniref:alpha/beta hydrolase n=1 Tax=Fructobacillus sp. CRL 2054 TaxID=2763007 RepID=UPI0023A63D5C|nr:alpha/beta hydrolase [Fructobacillus sp. CRL 2054]